MYKKYFLISNILVYYAGSDTSDSSTTSLNSSCIEKNLKSLTLPPKLDVKNIEWDELDELLQVERKIDDSEKLYQTMPVPLPSQSSHESNETNTQNIEAQQEVEPQNLEKAQKKELPNRSLVRDDSWIEKGKTTLSNISETFI